MIRMSLFTLRSVMERLMQIKKYTESLPNMEEPQLPVSMLQHMEQMGLLPVSHDDDGVNNIDVPWKNETNYFRRDVLDDNNEPLF